MLKDIVVFVDPSGKGDEWLRFAASVAIRYKARLVGVYVVGDPSPSHGYVRGRSAIQTMIESFVIREQRKATCTGNHFMEIASQYNAKARFRVVWRDADTDRKSYSTRYLPTSSSWDSDAHMGCLNTGVSRVCSPLPVARYFWYRRVGRNLASRSAWRLRGMRARRHAGPLWGRCHSCFARIA